MIPKSWLWLHDLDWLSDNTHEINQIILLALKLVSFTLLSSPSSCLFVSFQINKKKKPVQSPTHFSTYFFLMQEHNNHITFSISSQLFFSTRSTPVRCQYTDVSPCSISMAICRWNPHPNAYRGHSKYRLPCVFPTSSQLYKGPNELKIESKKRHHFLAKVLKLFLMVCFVIS